MNISDTNPLIYWSWSISLPGTQSKASLQEEEMSLMFSGKQVDFMRRLFNKQHDFNGTSLEVSKIRQSFYLGHHAQQKFS